MTWCCLLIESWLILKDKKMLKREIKPRAEWEVETFLRNRKIYVVYLVYLQFIPSCLMDHLQITFDETRFFCHYEFFFIPRTLRLFKYLDFPGPVYMLQRNCCSMSRIRIKGVEYNPYSVAATNARLLYILHGKKERKSRFFEECP